MREHFEGKGVSSTNSWETKVGVKAPSQPPVEEPAPSKGTTAPSVPPTDDIDSVMDDEFSAAISRISG